MNVAALLTKLLKRDTLHLGLAPASWQPARSPRLCASILPGKLSSVPSLRQRSSAVVSWGLASCLFITWLFFNCIQPCSGASYEMILWWGQPLNGVTFASYCAGKFAWQEILTRNVHLPFLDGHAIKMRTLWSLQCPGCYSGMSCKTVPAPKPYSH